MANPARCFLPCSCVPLSEALSAPCEEQPFGLTSSQTTTISPGEQRSKRPRPALLWASSDGSPPPRTSSSSSPYSPPSLAPPHLPTARSAPRPRSPLTASFRLFAAPNLAFFFLLLAHSTGFGLLLSRLPVRLLSTTALPFAISHRILLPACSSSYS